MAVIKKINGLQNSVLDGGNTASKAPATTTANTTATPVINAGTKSVTSPATTKTETPATQGQNYSGGYSSPVEQPAAAPAPMAAVAPSKSTDRSLQDQSYDAYVAAMNKLQQQMETTPTYTNQYEGVLNSMYDQIVNREAFKYNLNDDQMYQQYRDKYLQQAKLSMMDTMGRASGLTGGYGSSYGQMVGQQGYDAQLQQLNDIVPQLYSQAYGMYQDQGNQMLKNYQMTLDREATDYGRYQDDLSQWNTDRNFLQNSADNAYSKWINERNYADNQEQQIKAERADNLNKLLGLAALGYSPSAQEIADAGITPDQWNYYRASVMPQESSGGGGGSASSGNAQYLPGTSVTTDSKGNVTSAELSKEQYDGVIKTIQTNLKYGNQDAAFNALMNSADSMSTSQYNSAKKVLGLK